MTFSVLAVRTGEEPETPLYPDPGGSPDSIELTPADGQVQTFSATGLTIISLAGARPQQLAQFSDITATVLVTDQRLAVACSKYDTGGGSSGFGLAGLAVAVTANVVSKGLAKRRRKGKTLVGHVRYDWLHHLEATDRTGLLSKNSLEVLLADPTADGVVVLAITLGKHETATSVADQVARRAAAYKLAHLADDPNQTHMQSYAQRPTYETLADGSRRYRLPCATP